MKQLLTLVFLLVSLHQPTQAADLLRRVSVLEPTFTAGGATASVTIDAPAYTRTVTASSYTLTGTSTGSGAVTWSASPSGSSGACTGTDTWSCVVTVTPDAVGEGVEVITVTRGAASDTETLGFYVAGAHSTFLSQNVNGSYNVGLADLDAVSTWENVGTSALDITQAGAAALKPTFRTAMVGGQPTVRCDGGDSLAASTATDWTFLNSGVDWTIEINGRMVSGLGSGTYIATAAASGGNGTAAINVANDMYLNMYNATPAQNFSLQKAYTINVFHLVSFVLDDDGGAGADLSNNVDSLAAATAARASTYSATTASALSVCKYAGGTFPLLGDLFRVLIYQSALDSTQRGINKAVDEWALGGTLPVTP